jgi:hypothetical protein
MILTFLARNMADAGAKGLFYRAHNGYIPAIAMRK